MPIHVEQSLSRSQRDGWERDGAASWVSKGIHILGGAN